MKINLQELENYLHKGCDGEPGKHFCKTIVDRSDLILHLEEQQRVKDYCLRTMELIDEANFDPHLSYQCVLTLFSTGIYYGMMHNDTEMKELKEQLDILTQQLVKQP